MPGRRLLKNSVERARPAASAGGIPYSALLEGRSFGHAVVVVSSSTPSDLIDQVVRAVAASRVTLVAMEGRPGRPLPSGAELVAAGTADEFSNGLMARGAVDILVDLDGREPRERRATLTRGLYHLHPGGLFIVDRRTGPPLTGVPGVLAQIVWLAQRLGADVDGLELTRRQQELLRATHRIVIDPQFLAVEKQGTHLAKLRFAQVDAVLPARSPDVSVRRLATLPPGTLVSQAHQVQHESTRPHVFDDTMVYPEAVLRVYSGPVTSSSHGMLTTDSSILPDSFRHYDRPTLVVTRVPRATDVNRDFARLSLTHPHRLRGQYFHLDPAVPRHFGHLMGEVVSRLWGWDLATAEYPDLKALFHTSQRDPAGRLERQILTAYGIPDRRITAVSGPVQVGTLVTASALWHNHDPHHVQPQMREIWERLRRGFTPADPGPTFDRLFVTRPTDRNRACRNTAQVEDFFRQHGFEVLRPEEHPLSRQAELFGAAHVIAGFGGSAMFNLMFAAQLRLLIVLNHEGYTANNEHFAASLLGCEEHFFWSRPDIEHPAGGWTDEAFKSPWRFDFDRNRDELTSLLRDA